MHSKSHYTYVDSPNWIKNKNATINPINKEDIKCFQYDATVGLYHKEIGNHAKRMTNIKPFINRYKWKRRNFRSEKIDWRKIM